MKKGYISITFVALLGIAFLFAGSACTAVDFPADEAGISAYINVSTRAGATTRVVDDDSSAGVDYTAIQVEAAV